MERKRYLHRLAWVCLVVLSAASSGRAGVIISTNPINATASGSGNLEVGVEDLGAQTTMGTVNTIPLWQYVFYNPGDDGDMAGGDLDPIVITLTDSNTMDDIGTIEILPTVMGNNTAGDVGLAINRYNSFFSLRTMTTAQFHLTGGLMLAPTPGGLAQRIVSTDGRLVIDFNENNINYPQPSADDVEDGNVFVVTDLAAVPEPTSMALLLAGGLTLAAWRVRKRTPASQA